ncbi:hypothetical protein [Paenarthrobacter nitroguajacolicus]|uniref:hypothetical protein n=1 Tax=Paenarthrobacter nitroguajacolicus TaxID=211146 RepID=UPI004053F526
MESLFLGGHSTSRHRIGAQSAGVLRWIASGYSLPAALAEEAWLHEPRQTAVERCASALAFALARTATAYSRNGTRAPMEASNAVPGALGALAVAADLQTARGQCPAAIQVTQKLDDPEASATFAAAAEQAASSQRSGGNSLPPG